MVKTPPAASWCGPGLFWRLLLLLPSPSPFPSPPSSSSSSTTLPRCFPILRTSSKQPPSSERSPPRVDAAEEENPAWSASVSASCRRTCSIQTTLQKQKRRAVLGRQPQATQNNTTTDAMLSRSIQLPKGLELELHLELILHDGGRHDGVKCGNQPPSLGKQWTSIIEVRRRPRRPLMSLSCLIEPCLR